MARRSSHSQLKKLNHHACCTVPVLDRKLDPFGGVSNVGSEGACCRCSTVCTLHWWTLLCIVQVTVNLVLCGLLLVFWFSTSFKFSISRVVGDVTFMLVSMQSPWLSLWLWRWSVQYSIRHRVHVTTLFNYVNSSASPFSGPMSWCFVLYRAPRPSCMYTRPMISDSSA